MLEVIGFLEEIYLLLELFYFLVLSEVGGFELGDHRAEVVLVELGVLEGDVGEVLGGFGYEVGLDSFLGEFRTAEH